MNEGNETRHNGGRGKPFVWQPLINIAGTIALVVAIALVTAVIRNTIAVTDVTARVKTLADPGQRYTQADAKDDQARFEDLLLRVNANIFKMNFQLGVVSAKPGLPAVGGQLADIGFRTEEEGREWIRLLAQMRADDVKKLQTLLPLLRKLDDQKIKKLEQLLDAPPSPKSSSLR